MIPTRKDDVVDDYHGTAVADPYRWLEDDASQETRAWVEEQNRRTRAYLDALPARPPIHARLTSLMDYPRWGVPRAFGSRVYYSKNDGLQNQSVLYRRDEDGAEPVVVIDPNQLSDDGTVALTLTAFSHDGALLAYGTSLSGSDRQELHIRDVAAGTDLPETIRWCKFADIAWARDNSGFYYDRLPEPGTVPPEDENNYSRVYWHRLGTPQEQDALVYEQPEQKELGFSPIASDDGRYLLLYVSHGTDPRNGLYVRPFTSREPFMRLFDVGEAVYNPIETVGSLLYVHTDLGAPRGRVVAIDLDAPGREQWREVVPQGDDVIDTVAMVADRLIVVTMHDAHHQIAVYDLDGRRVAEAPLPTLGAVAELSGRRGDSALFFAFTSYLYPTTVLRYDVRENRLAPYFPAASPFDPSPYETTQVFFPSRDGTRLSMYLTHRKDLPRDGHNPVLLYGYGGFNISLMPHFAVAPLVLLEAGGVYAEVNLRGGGEYGEEWHRAGMLEQKQNVFDDFIAAAEWLIAHGYTEPSRLAIEGGSNGGLLVAACMLQRPDLYGAVLCAVPVTDMLRYHRFTVGRYWVPEYGNAEEDPDAFRYLYAYSPLHNVVPGTTYPATLIATADTDDRVVPAHARKFAAALQAGQAGESPILLRVETKAGHGLGKPTAKVIDEQADLYAFLFDRLGIVPPRVRTR